VRRYLYLLRYITRHWKGRLLIFAVTLLSGSLGLLQPWPMKILVDNVLGSRSLPPPLAHVAHILPGALTPQGLLVWVVLASMAVFAINSTVDVILTRAWGTR
jgi:ABC-type bacteriocin/lantibiotic exporter with double-glycine peptidase domain